MGYRYGYGVAMGRESLIVRTLILFDEICPLLFSVDENSGACRMSAKERDERV